MSKISKTPLVRIRVVVHFIDPSNLSPTGYKRTWVLGDTSLMGNTWFGRQREDHSYLQEPSQAFFLRPPQEIPSRRYLNDLILCNLGNALSRRHPPATMTERRRLNGLTAKEVWAWWNYDRREVDGKGKGVKRMTKLKDENLWEF